MEFTRLTRFLDGLQDIGIAGADCAVYQKGEQVYRHLCGYADLETKTPIREDTLYRFYSMTKVVTCAAALQLYEQGAFLLSDPLSMYLPEFAQMWVRKRGLDGSEECVPATRPIRVRDLFTMSAGLTYNVGPEFEGASRDTMTTRQFAKTLAKAPLSFEPGTRWLYSYCHDVLGALIEVISGKRFGEYLQERIFAPLGMEDTSFWVPEAKQGRLASCYEYHEKARTHRKLSLNDEVLAQRAYESGGGGLVSSVDDYAKFANAMCMGTRVLSRATIDLMRTNHLDAARMADFSWEQMAGYGYGLGVRTYVDPAKGGGNGSIGEFGWAGMAGTYVAIDPAKELVIVYAQQMNPSMEPHVHPRLRNIVYACVE